MKEVMLSVIVIVILPSLISSNPGHSPAVTFTHSGITAKNSLFSQQRPPSATISSSKFTPVVSSFPSSSIHHHQNVMFERDPIFSAAASADPDPQVIRAPSSSTSASQPQTASTVADSPPSLAVEANDPRPNVGVFPFSPGAASIPTHTLATPLLQPEPDLILDDTPPGSLIARIHGQGILGYVLFTPDSQNSGRTVIRARLTTGVDTGRKELFNWKIHSFPQQMTSLGCSSISIGPMMFDLSSIHGQLPSDQDVAISSTVINLFSEDNKGHILGRSLVLHSVSSGRIVCGTILPPSAQKRVYEAKFHNVISGSVRLIQTPIATGVLTEYMMFSDGSRVTSTHNWNIIQGVASDATLDMRFKYERSACFGLTNSQSGASQSLLSRNQASQIPVSTEMPGVKGRSYQVIAGLKGLDTAPINYIAIMDEEDGKKIISCAPLLPVRSKTAVAKFSTDLDAEVSGSMSFSQETPFDPTKIDVNLRLKTKAYSYGIDLLPTIRRRRNEPKSCPNIKETIYNPFFKDPEEIPSEGNGSTDQFAVGDLSGKFGSLSGKEREVFTAYDFNLPLFGQFSVIGRAVVIYAPEGPAISCTNIELSGNNVTTAYATFDVPLQGQFIFRQATGHCYTDTYVYIEISKPDGGDNRKTFNHPWHIHESPVNAGFDHLSSTDCAPAGKHLNPYNVSTDCIYQRDCTMFTPFRCEVGDSSGKLGPIDVPTYKSGPGGEPDVGKYYFVDTDVSLCGPINIIGRSVVIHERNFGSKRLTCANILEFKPRVR